MLNLKTLLTALSLLALAACAQKHPAQPDRDPRALEIVQRAAKAPEGLDHVAVEMEQNLLTHIASGQRSLSAIEEKRLSRHTRTPQPDGSVVFTERIWGHFEYSAPGLRWSRMQRLGGDGHVTVIFSDGQNRSLFMTRFPDSIARSPIREEDKEMGTPALDWMAQGLVDDSREATAIRLRERELVQGALCEVIELTVPNSDDDENADGPRRQITYYVGVADNLVHRYVETQGTAHRRGYRETVFSIDPTFVPKDISYARFEAEVRSLLKGKPLPPVVAKME